MTERITYSEERKPDLKRLKRAFDRCYDYKSRIQTISGVKVLVFDIGEVRSYKYYDRMKVLEWNMPVNEGYEAYYMTLSGKGICIVSIKQKP